MRQGQVDPVHGDDRTTLARVFHRASTLGGAVRIARRATATRRDRARLAGDGALESLIR